jgi:competence protein ComEC
MLGTMPLIALYFNRLSIVSLLANIVIVPILGIFAIPVSMAMILFLPISSMLSTFFLDCSGTLVMISLAINDYFASLSWAAVYLTTPSLPELLFFYLLLYGIVKALSHYNRYKNLISKDIMSPAENKSLPDGIHFCPVWVYYTMAVAIIFFFLNAVYLYQRNFNRTDFSTTAIDVGQGSSTLVRFPGGQNMLIDGGGFLNSTFDVGKYIVAPYLWHERISRIDIVVLTHPHPDHLNGLPFILENFPVREIWLNGERSGSDEYIRLENIINDKGIVQRFLSAGSAHVTIGGVEIRCLNPSDPVSRAEDEPSFTETNDDSLVMRMTYGKISFLFTGDISSLTENRLAADFRDLNSQFLFVSHHGGRTSSSEVFLHCVRPQAAIISVGADNLFRLPHPLVMERLNNLGASIYRTDIHGAVTVSTEGGYMSIDPYLRPDHR